MVFIITFLYGFIEDNNSVFDYNADAKPIQK